MVNIFNLNERIEYLKKYGQYVMAYSTLQPGMQYFDVPGLGYIAYMTHGGTRFVLGDPICAEGDREKLIGGALREHPKTSFYQISKSTAELLHKKFGYYMNVFGTETFIYRSKHWPKIDSSKNYELDSLNLELLRLIKRKDETYSLLDNKPELKKEFWRTKREVQDIKRKIQRIKEQINHDEVALIKYLRRPESYHIRRQYNLALSKEIRIFEENISENNYENLVKISKEWVSTRMVSSNEMKFFTRPLTLNLDSKNNVRLFTAVDKNNNLIGFLLIDPLFLNNKIIGYYADILRIKRNAPVGTSGLLLIAAMDAVFEEGYEVYSLGLSPFHRASRIDLISKYNTNFKKRADNAFLTFVLKNLFLHGNFLYNSRDQAFHKERFNGVMQHTYCAIRKKIPFWEILGGFLVSGINPIKQLMNFFREK